MFSISPGLAVRPAPRTGDARQHELVDALMIAFTTSICGAEG
jgi:hypothetical protein